MVKENIYSSICPGCSLGCGLYVREAAAVDTANANDNNEAAVAVTVDFRKNAPVNAGKLCRFGMKLPGYYGKTPVSRVNGKKVELEDAEFAATNALKAAPSGSLAFLSVGNTTNEEQQAFIELAEAFSCPVETGMGIYASFPAFAHPAFGSSVELGEIETAKEVILFVDPYVQYPLALRRVIKAKKNGAKITAVGSKVLPVADENLSLWPEEYAEALSLTRDSVLVADLHPYSDARQLRAILNLAGVSGAKLLFLRPFVNSKGTALLAKHTKQRSFEKLVEGIEAGEIKTLFCLDSDLLGLTLEPEKVKEALSKLDTLIVQASRESPITELADIVLEAEPFYRKQGSVLNAEGRLLENGGSSSTCGFETLAAIVKPFGKELDFDRVRTQVLKSFGIQGTADKSRVREAQPVPCKFVELRKIAESEGSEETEPKICFSYVFNPFMWHGVEDDSDFVELNFDLVQKFRLPKGGTVKIKSQHGQASTGFKVSDVADGFVLSGRKVIGIGSSVAEVELSR